MKALYNKLLALGCAGILIMGACKKDEVRVVAAENPTGGSLKASATTVVLDKDKGNDDAITFNFTKPDFGYTAAVANSLEIAVKGSNFSVTKEFNFDAGETSKVFTVEEFNKLLLALQIPTEVPVEVELRLRSSISGNLKPVYSNSLPMTVTAYSLASYLYVPGSYQGWDPATAVSLVSLTSNGIYTGTITFSAANSEFKITPERDWDVSYGDGGNGTVNTTGGGNFKVAEAGTYNITLDMNTNTIKLEKQ